MVQKKCTYIAVFSNGQRVVRKSVSHYVQAWAVFDKETGRLVKKGFQGKTVAPPTPSLMRVHSASYYRKRWMSSEAARKAHESNLARAARFRLEVVSVEEIC